jgi:disulfide bond formation protein DsbB
VRVYQFRHTGLGGYLYPPRQLRAKRKSQLDASAPRRTCINLQACIDLQDRQIAAGGGRHGNEAGMKATWSEYLRREPAVAAALAVFALAAATLLGAWYFQYVLKLPPCPLCLEERLPYHIVVPLALLIAIAALVHAPRQLIAVGFLAVLLAALAGAALGAYHSGVEWHWWAGPTDCSGPMTDFTAKGALIDQLQSIRVVRCDEAAWRFLGLSLAGYNVLISLALAAIAAYGLFAPRRTA